MHAAVSEATERDRDIMELLGKVGRDRAFEQLLRRYEGKVYRLCCALLRDRVQAEDAAQESLVRVWKALDRYDGRASLSSWIYAITRNRCLTALEKRRSLESLDDMDERPELGMAAIEPCDGRAEQLLGLVDLLPERSRRALVPEVPNTFRTRLNAALSRTAETDLLSLRERLESERRQQLEELQAHYLRVRRSTLGTLVGVAFAAGAAATIAMPWLRAHLGAYTPVAITWGAVALGLGMVFLDPLYALLRRWLA